MSNETEYIKVCSQPLCQYSKTGICMEGDIANCQYIKEQPKDQVDDAVETAPAVQKNKGPEDVYQLSSGGDLPENEVSSITFRYPSKLIVLVGEPECGKSTLYASLFDRFQKGGCGEYLFAGTSTPIGFEKRGHMARVASGRVESNNERTKALEFSYLHLCVANKHSLESRQHLLFADVNGEKYQQARKDNDDMKTLTIFKRASQIFFIADGDILLDDAQRHVVKMQTIRLLERALENDMFRENQKVHLIVTKWDKVNQAGQESAINDFFITPLLTKFPALIDKIVLKIASRSQNEQFPAGTGIDQFLEKCLTPQPSNGISTGFDLEKDSREFQKFKYSGA